MGVHKMFSSSSNDCSCNQNYEEFKPSPKLDNYTIVKFNQVHRNLVVKIKYNDVNNYEGNKILVYEDFTIQQLKSQELIDPHFSKNIKLKFPIARFESTNKGWVLATKPLIIYKMKAETVYEVIEKLIGPIDPEGDSAIDAKRLVSMEAFIEIFNMMHLKIDTIAYEYKNSKQASIKRIVDVCNKHLDSMGIVQ